MISAVVLTVVLNKIPLSHDLVAEHLDASTPVDTMTKEERRKLKKEKKKLASLIQLDGGRPSILLSRNYHMKLKLKVPPRQ
jgi:hypothetical protein